MESINALWEAVCSEIKENISEVAFNVWIKILTPQELKNSTVILSVPTDFQKGIVTANYLKPLENAFEKILGFPVELQFVLKTEEALLEKDVSEKVFSYTFDNFIVGPSNRFANAAALAVAANPGGQFNPLFIYGNSGLGKTHLLNAIYNEVRKTKPEMSLIYTRGEEFANELIVAINQGNTAPFHDKFRNADILFMDDIHFIAGKEQTQEEFFNTFNVLHQDGKQIVVTSDRPPKEIQTLDERIRSRFENGLLADISPPDFETRIAIIRRKANQFSFDIPNDVVSFIAEQLKSNIRQLEGTVKKLYAFKQLTGETPTITNSQRAISDIRNDDNPAPITIERIIAEVARTYGISPDDIFSKKQNSSVSYARHVAIYVSREITQLPYEEIGKRVAGRDHSTVSYSLNKIEKILKKNPKEKAIINDIINNISNV